MVRLISGLVSLVLVTSVAQAGAVQESVPYSLANTAVHQIAAPRLKRDYQIFVSLPKGYSESGPKLPVVFVTDADYAFPLVRAIAARVGGHSNRIAPFVLVGLSYAVGDTPEYSRRRDYTPSEHGDSSLKSDMPGRKPAFGEAEGYRRFLAQDVLPYVRKHYNVDMSRSVFVGHSYGALLGTDILFNDPAMFGKYVLSSPSLWFNKRTMFGKEKSYAGNHKDLKADVFFSVGGLERPQSRADDDDDMVGDLREFNANLKSRRYPNLKTQVHVFDGHDHLTVFPDMIMRALPWATH